MNSRGAKRSLGWIPFKAVQIKRQGRALRFCGKSIRVFEAALLDDREWKSGCFTQDCVGDWWLCLPVAYEVEDSLAPEEDIGIDLGLKDTAATSDGEKLVAGHFYRRIEQRIAQAQRPGAQTPGQASTPTGRTTAQRSST
jgi:putative transposase